MEEGHANRKGALSNSPRPAGAGTAELGAAKYGTAKVLKRTARAEVPLHVSGARPSWGPHPGLPWPQRPLQEDQSRYAENQPHGSTMSTIRTTAHSCYCRRRYTI